MSEESPFACDMTAISADQRDAHLATIAKLFRVVESVHELPNGYRFRLPNDSATVLTAAQFIPLERLCCAFFGFGLEIEPVDGGFWLSLTGREGVKPFIMAEIGNLLPLNIRNFSAAGTGSEATPERTSQRPLHGLGSLDPLSFIPGRNRAL